MSEAVVFVVTSGLDIGSPIVAGLAARGARVAWLTDTDGPPVVELGAAVLRLGAALGSRAALESSFAAAAERLGTPTQVVISALPFAALQAKDIGDVGDAEWHGACRAAMKSVLYGLQASYTQMAAQGGSIVVVGPSLSLAGAPQLVALSTAVEGQRGLVKSSARQWGQRGVTVNWIATAPRGLSPVFAKLPLPVKPDAVMVALGRPLDTQREIVPMIEFLGSPGGRAMTGATLMLDGGEWMVP